jgi:hypothetical protein
MPVLAVCSRRRRAASLRQISISRRVATVISQPVGFAGTPWIGHCAAASRRASWMASSHLSKS